MTERDLEAAGDSEPVIIYYAGEGFYFSDMINTAFANGFTMDDLTEISQADYDAWFNPPAGKMGAWVDGRPVLVDLPPVDHEAINTEKREEMITAALATVAAITAKLNMGRKLTQAETDKMNKVLDYIDVLNALDMTQTEIDWPAL